MQVQKTVSFYTLGCKLNFAETSAISRQFTEAGYNKVEFETGAEIVVINTCSVTENADKECKKVVKSALKLMPSAFIIIVGCYAQLKPQEIAEIPGVDLVLGASEKFAILKYLQHSEKQEIAEIHSCEIEQANFFKDAYSIGDRTRAFLKVQDGCDYTCSYCTIPLARGISRSDTVENVIASAKNIASQGIREIVLTGVNIGDYGKGEFGNKKHAHTFLDLVKALDQVESIERIRISSIEPNLLKDETIEFVAQSKRFVPHFHIPLQSGSNKILKLMRRRYLRELYAERVAHIKKVLPHCCIGVDVIVGFPGESDEDFLETYHFLNELNISYLHVFTYSERDNTDAASMPNVVPISVRRKRNKMLRILSEKKRRHFYEQQLGKTYDVLFEADNKNGMMHGFTTNYVKVKTVYDSTLINTTIASKLIKIDTDGDLLIEQAALVEV
ncbi:MAG TPA: tRNA (N(6)-L-threonylcarbamoyladenosine(37)-C(2))-methylthiotransferase MtaB [Bacteroidia bacterium]|nr:tRNA (N(6)-L-threonylcarbamoyladenosine(37)-C(2))-methylthiotransferase MtaB [Bacteroidia bacterium]HRH09126.1 tRNA (N(6)-L-threonylcarbamoyladenosine(37)-C(2))-methylthiotransferase MtaB [Bacteroidia bacterium]